MIRTFGYDKNYTTKPLIRSTELGFVPGILRHAINYYYMIDIMFIVVEYLDVEGMIHNLETGNPDFPSVTVNGNEHKNLYPISR